MERNQAANSTYSIFKARYRDDPAGFVLDCIKFRGDDRPAEYQLDVLRNLVAKRRAAVRGPHGLGKTALASWAILWFALTRDGEDWKIATTASAWRQLVKFLWPELHKWARRLDWSVIGRPSFGEGAELLGQSLKLDTGEAFALASDRPESIEGAHASHLLYVLDEAKTIPGETFDAVEGALSIGDCYALAISTPGEPQGRFYDIHRRAPGFDDWWVRHVTLAEAIAAGRVSEQWAAQRRRQWGEKSAVYQNRVLGEFAASDEDGVIPLSWVELANERWENRGKLDDFTCVGVDVARSGADDTVMAMRYSDVISELRRHSKEDTMETTGRVAGILRANGGKAIVDVIGVGAGVVDRLREIGLNVAPFNASEGTNMLDRSGELGFVNLRSAAWWNLREMLDPNSGHSIAFPADDLLTGDLTAPHWKVASGGKVQVEGKDDIKKRIGRSTDCGDAVVMAFWHDMTSHGIWL